MNETVRRQDASARMSLAVCLNGHVIDVVPEGIDPTDPSLGRNYGLQQRQGPASTRICSKSSLHAISTRPLPLSTASTANPPDLEGVHHGYER